MKAHQVKFTAMLLAAMVSGVSAAPSLFLNFGQADGPVTLPYTTGPGDILGGATVNFSDPSGPGDPDVTTPPSIATVPSTPMGDGKVLVSGNDSDGIHIGLPAPITSSFTAEVIFRVTTLDPPTLSTAGVEHGLQTIFGSDGSGNAAAGYWAWQFRTFYNGTGTIGPFNGELQLNTSNGTEHNLFNTSPPIATSPTWHHAVMTYDSTSGQAEYFLNGVSQGTVAANFGAQGFSSLSVAYWMNDANTNRSMIGEVDAVSISPGILTPATFSLPAELSIFSAN